MEDGKPDFIQNDFEMFVETIYKSLQIKVNKMLHLIKIGAQCISNNEHAEHFEILNQLIDERNDALSIKTFAPHKAAQALEVWLDCISGIDDSEGAALWLNGLQELSSAIVPSLYQDVTKNSSTNYTFNE